MASPFSRAQERRIKAMIQAALDAQRAEVVAEPPVLRPGETISTIDPGQLERLIAGVSQDIGRLIPTIADRIRRLGV